MADKYVFQSRKLFRWLEIILYLITLLLSLQVMNPLALDGAEFEYCMSMFGAAALSYIANAIYIGSESKTKMRLSFIYAGLYFIASFLTLMIGTSYYRLLTVSIITIAAITLSRLYAVVHNHNPFMIFLFIVYCAWTWLWLYTIKDNEPLSELMMLVILGGVMATIMIKRLIGISLSNLKYELMLNVAKKSMAGEILTGLSVLILASVIVFKSQEPMIESYPDALWYCFAIITTIGFGDITAVTPFGRILSVFLGIYGIIVVSLITSIIVNFYNEIKDIEDVSKTNTDEKSNKKNGSE